MGGSKWVSVALAVVGGVIIADIMIHPAGTIAAGSAANAITVPAEASLLGAVPGYAPGVGGYPKAA